MLGSCTVANRDIARFLKPMQFQNGQGKVIVVLQVTGVDKEIFVFMMEPKPYSTDV